MTNETRHIELPSGFRLDVQMTQAFVERVKRHYGLSLDSALSDDHVQRYVVEATKVALDGAVQ
jgi:hypothetical protein